MVAVVDVDAVPLLSSVGPTAAVGRHTLWFAPARPGGLGRDLSALNKPVLLTNAVSSQDPRPPVLMATVFSVVSRCIGFSTRLMDG